ncbi:MAG: penicillin-binding protein 2 [Candidatus Gracilibacteria bacterium]|nr:penicillin-binding protein 2 [Candidatus Gracilibacteria bacterium]
MQYNNFLKNLKSNYYIKKIISRWTQIHTIIVFFVLFFLVIIKTLFSYTVSNYSYYNGLADAQQIGKVSVPVNRGAIYSGGDKNTVLATSLHLYDLAVDPQMIGDKEKLSNFLVDIVYNESCNNKNAYLCKNNILKYLKVLEIENFVNDEKYIKNLLKDKIVSKLLQTKVTSVLIDKELSPSDILQIKNLGFSGLYPTDNYLYINPEEFDNSDSHITELSKIVGTNEERLKSLTRKRELRYVPIINKISIDNSDYITSYIKDEKEAISRGILSEEKAISSFFILSPFPNRYYPESNLASQVVGFVDNAGVGNYGLEGYFNDILKGNNGEIVSRKDINGRIIDPISLNQEDLIGEGIQIISTIDRNVQKKVEQLLEDGVKKYRANKGSIIVMDPKTGNIIAMANYPTYDLNNFGDVYELEKVKYSEFPNPATDLLGFPIFVEDNQNGTKFIYDNKEINLREATREELGNMALVKYKYKNGYGAAVYSNDIVSAVYEPGSVMKMVTVAAGIDTGEINKNSMYQDNGFVEIDNFKISNVAEQCKGYHTFGNALNYSCNVGMIRIAQKVGKTLMYQYYDEFGFGKITGIDLQGEVSSRLEPWEKRSQAGLFTRSYGLGISITQLQVAAAYNAIANSGVFVKPKIIDKIVYPDGKEVVYKTEEERRVVKESTSKVVTNMLYDGCTNGVAKNGFVKGYAMACKSGTAQISYKGGYETGVGSTVGTFAGFGPVEDPKFTIVVKLERIRTSAYGGETSGHIFADVAKYLLDYYKIPKKEEKEDKIEAKK